MDTFNMLEIINILIISCSFAIIIFELNKIEISVHISRIASLFLGPFLIISISIYQNRNDVIEALSCLVLLTSEMFFVSVISQHFNSLLNKINMQIGYGLKYLIFFYCASPIAIISIYFGYFPDELFMSNCFISFTALYFISKYSVSLAMSKELKNISLFLQLFLLFILMTGGIFSFANFNYSINVVLGNISTDIKIIDYIFHYSSIFTLNYDSLILESGIDKLLASVSMIYSYIFISIAFTTIVTRLNNNT